MKKFFDVVKVNFEDELEQYFADVEVESIKMTKGKDALNFYLVSKYIIPYDIIEEAEEKTANGLYDRDNVSGSGNGELIKLINFRLRYELDSAWNCKNIFEKVENDFYKELKNNMPIAKSFIKEEFTEFTDDNTLKLGFDHISSFEAIQHEIVDYIKDTFKNKYGRDITINIQWVESSYGRNASYEAAIKSNSYIDVSKEKDSIIDNIKENGKTIDNEKKKDSHDINARKPLGRTGRRSGITMDGEILFNIVRAKTKPRRKVVAISELLYDMDNVEFTGVLYNLKKFISSKKEKNVAVFSLYVTDNENCIEIKFFGAKEDAELFDKRFKIGDELKVEGKTKYDTFASSYVCEPYTITKISHRTMIEYGKVGDDDYYNEIVTDRVDNEKVKRVELHLHTKSSAQDGIGDVKQYIATAKRFGMTAMAITDHGAVNALADAHEYVYKDLKDSDFKIINGVEGYLVEDADKYIYDSDDNEVTVDYSFDGDFVIYKIVTTGYNKKNDGVIKIIAKKISGKKEVGSFSEYVNTKKPISFEIKDKTGVTQKNVDDALPLKDVLTKFNDFIDGAKLVTIERDSTWKLNELFKEYGIGDRHIYIDFIMLAKLYLKELKVATISAIAKELKVNSNITKDKITGKKKKVLNIDENLALVSESFINMLMKLNVDYEIDNINQLKDKLIISDDYIRRQKYYHIILLAKNDVGRVNLYKIVSDSHIKYMYNKRPRIPRSLLNEYREGIIVGSACILGELMDAVKNDLPDDKLRAIASYYDYLEIQPTLNNSFLLKDEPGNFKTIKDLENLNIKIVKLGEELDKPVVATCDCHYVEKTDKIYREILRLGIMSKKVNRDKDGNIKAEVSAELESTNEEHLYFRTTKEMLDEFSYLGADKAYEVVVKNSNLISDMIEKIYPVRFDNCPPHIEGSEEELKDSCYQNLIKTYGEEVPKVIKDRLDNELKYIIDNGYSVMYISAKKLIDYSKENGYPVGSRGSVGSSLAATMSGVSEVNPLKPHYICPKCHHIEYDTIDTRKYDNDTGFDMPDKLCPKCNTLMRKDGVNIPFETFLGIPGDAKAQKEPDIDLNFCSVFQSRIHEKTIDMFGKDNTYKAGTVGTIASKTAYGYVMRFKEMSGLELNRNQVDFYKNKIVECKNTTGQHPGGMIVVPDNEKIYTFTPIQIAAGKEGNDITTHFDYHKIDKNLLKLDILGHDAPLILKKLQEATGVDFNTVPFYEKEVLDLFKGTESLGITPSDISGTKLGCLTIPEFGTDFAMNMCLDAKPKTVADLIRIAGLAHGTDVWQGNVQDLIKNGDCTLSTAICCRDDIMIYLKEKGLDGGVAFNIMERVRKGKKLTDEYRTLMREHGVPEWYIGCCDKIQYMFPKAHAAAYVLAALRIAYYKVHYPKEYYAVYFSVANSGFDYKLMIKDKSEIRYHIEKIARIINERKSKDRRFADSIATREKQDDIIRRTYRQLNGEEEEEVQLDEETLLNIQYEKMSAVKLFDLYMCYRHVEEMKARGIDFCPIDIYKAKRSDFQVIDGKIMPSFESINGIGTKEYDIDYNDEVPASEKSTAMRCEIEGRKGEYTSIENFIERTGVNKTRVAEMKELSLFGDLREKEETTVFDFI